MTRGGVSASPAMWGARAAVLAVLAVVVIGVVVRSTQEGSRAIPAGLGPDGSPLAAGVPSDLSSASATVGFEVPLPSVNGFMDSDAKQVWVRSAWDPEVFITYANGSDLVIKQADYPGGAVAFYEELQKQGVNGQLTDVSGVTVFVVPAGASSSDGVSVVSPANVMFVVNDLSVSLVSHDASVSIDDLENAAKSIIASAK